MVRIVVAFIVLLAAAPCCAGEPPNIILIVADDLGWTDPACMGSDYHRTPAIDRLARDGMVFTDAYSNAPNCAPSRAAIVSGMYAPRTGVYTVGTPDRGKSKDRRLISVPNSLTLAPDVVTIAERLESAGYDTGFVGKWHLGIDDSGPLAQGFDVNVGGNKAGAPRSYTSPYRNPNLQDGPEGEFLTERLTTEAISFVSAERERPYFLMLSYYAVHTPIHPDPRVLERVEMRAKGALHRNARYAALVEGMDDGIGRLLDAIDALDAADDTLIVLTSDNGGFGGATRMDPLRGEKGQIYEGGIRVPLIARWPGVIEAGSRCTAPVIGCDLYPTLVEIGGGNSTGSQPVDGVSIASLLAGGGIERRALYWHFPAYLEGNKRVGTWRATPCGAVRDGRWKLIEWFEDGRIELYDLASDVGERNDLADEEPALRNRLLVDLRAWRERVGAPAPTEPNPGFVESE